jgi:tetratricopeptide (TPR) repeat protein
MTITDPTIRQHLDASERALRADDRQAALRHAREALRLAPGHADTLRQLAAALAALGPSAEAVDAIERAVASRPDDAALITVRAIVLETNGRPHDALAAFRRAAELAHQSTSSLYNLGRALAKYAAPAESLSVLDQVLARDAAHVGARTARAEMLRQLGRAADSAADYRQLIERDPRDARWWSALATVDPLLDDRELVHLESIERSCGAPEAKARLGFSLGRLYETRGRYADAFAAFGRANAVVRSQLPWDFAAHSAEVDAVLAAFDKPAPSADTFGAGIIFIVSLPRSGSTLTEQMLASHRDVDDGGERSDLFDIFAAEGARRRMTLARWAPLATPQDWRRLGQDYLDRAAHWRGSKPFVTDKMPMNWLGLGAALAMLPGARVVHNCRDRLEAAWSCYAHVFSGGTQRFSYDFDSIAAYAGDHDRAMAKWKMLYPDRIRTQHYETMVADTEAQLRELLAFCGLDFDPACLRFHETRRAVRTASAVQVREPLRKDTARSGKYGALLDPLRAALGLSPYAG